VTLRAGSRAGASERETDEGDEASELRVRREDGLLAARARSRRSSPDDRFFLFQLFDYFTTYPSFVYEFRLCWL
jgi:hypothetical protein